MKMQFNLELSSKAEIDLENSFEYYNKQSKLIAGKFYNTVNHSLNIIKNNPYSFQVVYKNVRRFALNKFSFVIYYYIESNVIKVISIFHTSRNPHIWKKRD